MPQSPSRANGPTTLLENTELTLTRLPIEQTLESESFDAVVSPDDERLSHGEGVSERLVRLGGSALLAEITVRAQLTLGDIVVTSGGRLPVRWVLHAVTVDRTRGVLPSRRTFAHLARTLFVR